MKEEVSGFLAHGKAGSSEMAASSEELIFVVVKNFFSFISLQVTIEKF